MTETRLGNTGLSPTVWVEDALRWHASCYLPLVNSFVEEIVGFTVSLPGSRQLDIGFHWNGFGVDVFYCDGLYFRNLRLGFFTLCLVV